MESGWYILGNELKLCEEAFARYIGCGYGVGVANGTEALELALRACGIGRGDIVFTVSHTAVATVVAVELSGAEAILVDIDPTTYTMDPASLERAIRVAGMSASPQAARPKAIVAVHLYGHPADLPTIAEIARLHGLILIEDCAQAHGATCQGRRVGTWGQAAAFSFYPTKNLGAFGDGGMITTSDPKVAERSRMLREYGWRQRYVSEILGVNSRLDELQAAILLAKLEFLDEDNGRRQNIARRYAESLQSRGVLLPTIRSSCTHVFHQYVIGSHARDALREHLQNQGVGTLIHYPVPVHLQPAYRGRLRELVSLTQTEVTAQKVLSLPMYPELQYEQVDAVSRAFRKWKDPS